MHILKVPGVSGIAYLQLNHYLFIFLYLNLIWLGGNEWAILNNCAGAHQQNTGAPPYGPLQMSSGQQWENGFAGQFQVASVCKWMPRSRVKITNMRDWLGVTLALWL